jgi:hypothetical protein
MSVWMPVIAIVLAQTAPSAPSAEAEALGQRLAATGTLAALLPTLVAKDREELVARYPELSDAEKAQLRTTADDVAKTGIARLNAVIGHGYATQLSLEDLRALVAFNETPAARHWRAATPQALIQAMTALGEMDLKKDTQAAFCASTGKLCGK